LEPREPYSDPTPTDNTTATVTTFSFLNIQGLCPQTKPSSIPYLRDILNTEKHIFLGLTETWLSTNHTEAELTIDGYKFFRKDRNRTKSKHGRYSGGVAFYIREDIAPLFKPLLEFSNGVNEALLLYSNQLNILLGIIYRQPTNVDHKSDAPEFDQLTSSITSEIETIQGCTPDIYICGDFNIPHTFKNETFTPTTSCNRQLLKNLTDFTTNLNLNQVINKPTHSNGNILDFLLTNNSDSIFDYNVVPTMWSDHFFIDITTHMTFNNNRRYQKEKTYTNSKFDNFNFHSNRIDWETIKKDFEKTDWQAILTNTIPFLTSAFQLFQTKYRQESQ